MAALSLLTSGKYVIDPELRGAEFERITQNLNMQFWKSFWNLTESGLITVGRVKCFPTDQLPKCVLTSSRCLALLHVCPCRVSAGSPPVQCR